MPAGTVRSAIVALCWLLAGCGTDVKGLLDDESRTYWLAERIVAAAQERDPALMDALSDAEAAKYRACESINTAARKRIFAAEASFGDRLRSDLTELFVRVFPVGSVERCRQAHETYNTELAVLRRRLEDMGVEVEDGGAAAGP